MAQVLARSAAQRLRISCPPSLVQFRRGFAADHHGPKKVNIWEQPTNPGNWKEEQFVFVSLGGWGLVFYLGYKSFAGGKKPETKDISKEIEEHSIPEKHPEGHKA